ncbi:MAG: DUF881 domain-containing protein [Firmicutes bacterium]|nr:DUF881 domain-containing protein [Bacillota bacterium]
MAHPETRRWYQAGWRWTALFIGLVLGLFMTVQFRTQVELERANPVRTDVLWDLYRDSETRRVQSEQEVLRLRQELASNEQNASQAVQEELSQLRLLAGVTPVAGPGVTITLDDSTLPASGVANPELFLIHDEDLLMVLNTLFDAGAEAVSINGQRVISTTEVRCAGPTTSVNKVRVGVPYVIKAIGNPAALEAALKAQGGIIQQLQAWGIRVNITATSGRHWIRLPAYTGPRRIQYLHAVEGE